MKGQLSQSVARRVVITATLLGCLVGSSAALAVAPTVTTVSPVEGSPGAQVVINGKHFTGKPLVTFNGTIASADTTASTQIIVTVPEGASSGPVSVTTPTGTAITDFDFTVFGQGPVIRSFSPEEGEPGTRVTIKGVSLSGTTEVTFGGVDAANFQVTASTQVHAVVPQGAKSGAIKVTTSDGTALSDKAFTFLGNQPRIESFSPREGAPGETITLVGSNLGNVNQVQVNGVAASIVEIMSTGRLRARIPQNATSGPISASNPAGTGKSPTSLVVLRDVDLKVSTELVPKNPSVSKSLIFTSRARNIGQLPATGVTLFQIVPASVTIEGTTVSQGKVTTRGRLIKAELGRVGKTMSASLEVEVIPTEQTTITNRVLLSTLEPDRNTADNESTSVASVAQGELALELSPVNTNRVRLSWPAHPEQTTVQTTPALRPGTTWSNLTATPTVIEGRRVLPITIDSPQQFFRLKRLTN